MFFTPVETKLPFFFAMKPENVLGPETTAEMFLPQNFTGKLQEAHVEREHANFRTQKIVLLQGDSANPWASQLLLSLCLWMLKESSAGKTPP